MEHDDLNPAVQEETLPQSGAAAEEALAPEADPALCPEAAPGSEDCPPPPAAEDALAARLGEEAAALRALYPEMDLAALAEDERTAALLASGVTLQSAFEALHPDALRERLRRELIAAALARRPREIGLAAVQERAPEKRLTAADRSALIARARRGETITL